MAVIAKIDFEGGESASRPQVEIGDTLYALKNVSDFDLGEYGRLLRLTEYVNGLDLANALDVQDIERLDMTLDEAIKLLFWDELPQAVLDRLRDVQKFQILQAFMDASAGSSKQTSLTTRSRRSAPSTEGARATG